MREKETERDRDTEQETQTVRDMQPAKLSNMGKCSLGVLLFDHYQQLHRE